MGSRSPQPWAIPFRPPDELAGRIATRLFPWSPPGFAGWDTLWWANDRSDLGSHPAPGPEWVWHSRPLDEWDGTVPEWDPVALRLGEIGVLRSHAMGVDQTLGAPRSLKALVGNRGGTGVRTDRATDRTWLRVRAYEPPRQSPVSRGSGSMLRSRRRPRQSSCAFPLFRASLMSASISARPTPEPQWSSRTCTVFSTVNR